jgi:hypothetical protein
VLHVQHRHDRRAQAAHRAHRQIDLTEQQDVHDADRHQAHRRHLKDQVRQVHRAHEARFLDVEDQPDDREREHDPQLGEVARYETVEHVHPGAADLDVLVHCGIGRAHRCPPPLPVAPVIAPTTWS